MKLNFFIYLIIFFFLIFGTSNVFSAENLFESAEKVAEATSLLTRNNQILRQMSGLDLENEYTEFNELVEEYNKNQDRLQMLAKEVGMKDYPSVEYLEKWDSKILDKETNIKLEDIIKGFNKNPEIQAFIEDLSIIQELTEKISSRYKGTKVIFEKVSGLGGEKTSQFMSKTWNKHRLSSVGQPNLNVLIVYFEDEDLFSVARRWKGKISSKIVKEMGLKLEGAKTDVEVKEKLVEAIIYLEGEIGKLDKSWTDVFKNEDKEDLDTLIKIYKETGNIDLRLVSENYVKMEFEFYERNKRFKKYDDFKNFREKNLLKDIGEISKISEIFKIKDLIYGRLNLSGYNRDFSSVIDLFSSNKYQCMSITRTIATTIFATQPKHVSRELLIIHTKGHVLPGFIEGGRLIGIEGTIKGNSRVNFGKINPDKSIEGLSEKVIAVKADHQLFLDILKNKGIGGEIKDRLMKKAVVVNNNGASEEESSSSLGGASEEESSNIPKISFSFGKVDVPEGDITIMTRNNEVSFQNSQRHYNDIGYGTGSRGGDGKKGTGDAETTPLPDEGPEGQSSTKENAQKSYDQKIIKSNKFDLGVEEQIKILEVLSNYIRFIYLGNYRFYPPSKKYMGAVQEKWKYDFSYVLEKEARISYIYSGYVLFHDSVLTKTSVLYRSFPNKKYPEETQENYDAWQKDYKEFRINIAKEIEDYITYLKSQ